MMWAENSYRRFFASCCMFVLASCGRHRSSNGTLQSDGSSEVPHDGAAPDGPGAARRLFLTSGGFSGDLGGAAGADAKCDAAGRAANLGGVWRAFVSTSQAAAIARISDSGPWYNLRRTVVVFGSRDELTQNPRTNITEDENGQVADLISIWTATRSGEYLAPSCQDWTSASANLNGVFGEDGSSADPFVWSLAGVGAQAEHACDGALHLLCIEQ